VLDFFSGRPNWDFPTPSLEGECILPTFGSGRGYMLGGRGGGGPNSDGGTDTVVRYSTVSKYVLGS
jgi:hypothetical protein